MLALTGCDSVSRAGCPLPYLKFKLQPLLSICPSVFLYCSPLPSLWMYKNMWMKGKMNECSPFTIYTQGHFFQVIFPPALEMQNKFYVAAMNGERCDTLNAYVPVTHTTANVLMCWLECCEWLVDRGRADVVHYLTVYTTSETLQSRQL